MARGLRAVMAPATNGQHETMLRTMGGVKGVVSLETLRPASPAY